MSECEIKNMKHDHDGAKEICYQIMLNWLNAQENGRYIFIRYWQWSASEVSKYTKIIVVLSVSLCIALLLGVTPRAHFSCFTVPYSIGPYCVKFLEQSYVHPMNIKEVFFNNSVI